MAVFPVFCPSEPNQIFYYIILQFLPPISPESPRASVAPSVVEMFPLQPSVVMEGTYWKSKQEQEEGAEGTSPDSGQAPLWPGITAIWKEGVEKGELVHCIHTYHFLYIHVLMRTDTEVEIQASHMGLHRAQ